MSPEEHLQRAVRSAASTSVHRGGGAEERNRTAMLHLHIATVMYLGQISSRLADLQTALVPPADTADGQ